MTREHIASMLARGERVSLGVWACADAYQRGVAAGKLAVGDVPAAVRLEAARDDADWGVLWSLAAAARGSAPLDVGGCDRSVRIIVTLGQADDETFVQVLRGVLVRQRDARVLVAVLKKIESVIRERFRLAGAMAVLAELLPSRGIAKCRDLSHGGVACDPAAAAWLVRRALTEERAGARRVLEALVYGESAALVRAAICEKLGVETSVEAGLEAVTCEQVLLAVPAVDESEAMLLVSWMDAAWPVDGLARTELGRVLEGMTQHRWAERGELGALSGAELDERLKAKRWLSDLIVENPSATSEHVAMVARRLDMTTVERLGVRIGPAGFAVCARNLAQAEQAFRRPGRRDLEVLAKVWEAFSAEERLAVLEACAGERSVLRVLGREPFARLDAAVLRMVPLGDAMLLDRGGALGTWVHDELGEDATVLLAVAEANLRVPVGELVELVRRARTTGSGTFGT